MEPSPLTAASRACVKAFDTLVPRLETSRDRHRRLMTPAALRNQRDRFMVWTANTGALQRGNASLDFRLRDSFLMQETIEAILMQLGLTLRESNEIVQGLRLPLEEAPQPDEQQLWQDIDESDSDESNPDPGDIGPNLNEDDPAAATELGLNISLIATLMSELFKLSFRIRNPAARSAQSVSRALLHKELVQVDNTTSLDMLEAFSRFDVAHVEDSFNELRQFIHGRVPEFNDEDVSPVAKGSPPVGETARHLVERWGRSITYRRRFFAYWRKHARKLAKEEPEEVSEEKHAPAQQPSLAPSRQHALQPQGQVSHVGLTAPLSVAGKSILSETEASKYNRNLDDDVDNKSEVSYISTAYNIDGSAVELPQAPSLRPTQAEFICPYCHVACPAKHSKGKHWREHIIRDLQPYMCTYPDCHEPDVMYNSRGAWLHHEAQVHRRVWRCFEHNDLFKSSEALENHLGTAHRDLGNFQIQSMVDLGHASTIDDRTTCPFCLSDGPFQSSLANHMAFHMEKLAAFSVPRSMGVDDEDQSRGTNSNSAQEAHSMDSLRSVSLVFSSNGSLEAESGSRSGLGQESSLVQPQDLRTAFAAWLTPIDYSHRQRELIYMRQPETGQWFMESSEFLEWFQGDHATLYCSGILGSGKSVMTSIVVDQIEKTYSDDDEVGLAYVYFVNGQSSGENGNLEEILCSLIKQILPKHGHLPASVENLSKGYQNKPRTGLDIADILRSLKELTAEYSKVFIVLDALDALPLSTTTRLVKEILTLQEETELKFFVTSRPIPHIIRIFQASTSLEIRAKEEDVMKYVGAHTHELPRFIAQGSKLQADVKWVIGRSVDGMFSLARFYVDFLAGSSSLNAVHTALHELREAPRGRQATSQITSLQTYDHLYEYEMQRIESYDPSRRESAKHLLQWVAFANRRLTRSELRQAFDAEFQDSRKLKSHELSKVMDLCFGLLHVDGGELDEVQFSHYTTRYYYDRTRQRHFPGGHLEIAVTCIRYLSLDSFASGFCPTEKHFKERLQLHPLYSYAAAFWGLHAHEAASTPTQLVLDFLIDNSKVEAASQAMMVANSTPASGSQNVPRQMKSLHLTAYFGLDKVARFLLEDGQPVDQTDSHNRTPLSYAAQRGHASVVELLLKAGAKLESKDTEKGQTPLLFAVETTPHENVIQLLLEYGADVESLSGKHGWTPLFPVARAGLTNLVKLLLKEGADPNREIETLPGRPVSRQPLLAAAENGTTSLARLLLDNGADLEHRGWKGHTPLSCAVSGGRAGMVQFLLERGASIEIKDEDGSTPLSLAARRGNAALVELLLKHGADQESEDNEHRTPLQIALKKRHEAVVNLLRSNV